MSWGRVSAILWGEEARLGRIEAEGGLGDVLVDGRGTAAGLDTLLHGLRHCKHKLVAIGRKSEQQQMRHTAGDVAVHRVDDDGDLGAGHG